MAGEPLSPASRPCPPPCSPACFRAADSGLIGPVLVLRFLGYTKAKYLSKAHPLKSIGLKALPP